MAQPATAPTRAPVTTANVAPKLAFAPPEFKGERVESTIPSAVTHVILAGGFFGSGKTTFVAGIDRPENVLFLDFEGKGEGIARTSKIENYFCPPQDASGLYGMMPPQIATWERTKQILEAMPKDRFKVVLLDGLTILQKAIFNFVESAPGHIQIGLGVNPKNVLSGSMGGAWPGVGTVLQNVFNTARAKGVQCIGITTEAKAKWGSTGPILNKYQLSGQDIIHKMSVLSVVMIPGFPKYLGAPSALVLKEQLGESVFVDGRQRTRKRIPPKLPLAEMSAVYDYLLNPADYANLKPEEIPSLEEIEPFKPIVSKDQLASMDKLLELSRLTSMETEE
jgi:hypothetical protein